MSTSENSASNKTVELTEEQKQRIEKNKLKAIQRKQTRLVAHPYAKGEAFSEKNTLKCSGKNVIDTGAGFLIEEEEFNEEDFKYDFPEEAGPFIVNQPTCEECKETFPDSYLLKTFNHPVCDKCRDNDDKHSLITKTDAKKEYLLQDFDLDKREPPLKFIVRKNPHNSRWGNMKLYLQLQIEKRALEVWGSEENLREEIELREEKRIKSKTKKYHKQLKDLRMSVRSSLYDKTSSASHTHAFGPENYDEDEDQYSHKCLTCGYEETFEKM